MRILALTGILTVIGLAALPAATQQNWANLTFSDGQARSIDDFNGRTTQIYAFCRG